MIDPSARVHASADLEADVERRPGDEHLAPRPGSDRRPDRRRVRHRARRLHRRGRQARRPRQGPERRARLPRRHRRGRRVHRARRDPDQRPLPAGHHLDRRPRPGRGLEGQPDHAPLRLLDRAGAVVVAGIDVGSFATVGAGAVVTRPVADYALVVGNPARRIGWVCACGAAPHRRPRRPRAGSPPRYADDADLRLPELRTQRTSTSPMPRRSSNERAPAHRQAGSPRMIPIARPDVGPEEAAAVAEVLASGMIAQGQAVAELEERWAEFVGVKHAIAVTNGTVALMCIFAGLGLEPGDEVITVAHTFNATVSVDPVHRCDAGLRRHRARHVPDRRRPDRGGDHAADTSDLPGPPVRPRRRHGHDHRDRRSARADGRRGRLPGPRRDLPRPAGRQLRARGVQPVRAPRT